jgi:anthranilate synthase component 2
MRLLVLDNYDSFTFNLVHLVEKVCDITFDVVKNDQISLPEVNQYDKILLSPGPGIPSQAGIMPDLLSTYKSSKSILGVCLGLQAVGETFGASLINLNTVYHGQAMPIHLIEEDVIFNNCPSTFNAGRYHSWVIDSKKFPPELTVTAVDDTNLIMALKHKTLDVRGVQFHPESILSEYGETIIYNWLMN